MQISSIEREALKRAYLEKKLTLEDLQEIGLDLINFKKKFENFVIVDNTDALPKLILTDEGKKQVALWGVKQPEDFSQYAVQVTKILKKDPLLYYVKVFDKVHKGDVPLKILQCISAISASCANSPIHDFACGPSGSGKSHIKRKAVMFFPQDMYIRYSSCSALSLVYTAKEEGIDYYKNKIIFFDEAEASQDAVLLLRDLTDPDSKEVTHNTVIKQARVLLSLEKPVVVWFTSTQPLTDDQLNNRVLITNPDDSSELDQAVNDFQKAMLHRGMDLNFEPEEAPLVRAVFARIIDETKDLKVLIPFDIHWNLVFNRRLYPYFITLLQLITKIYYQNRLIKEGYILSTYADFKLAVEIWKRIVETTLGQVPKLAIDILALIPDNKEEAITYAELANKEECQLSTHKVKQLCKQLDVQGLINSEKESNRYLIWKSTKARIFINTETELVSDEVYLKEFLNETCFKDSIAESISNINQEQMEVLDNLDIVSFGTSRRSTFTAEDALTWKDKKEFVLDYFTKHTEDDVLIDKLAASYLRKFNTTADFDLIINKLKEDRIIFEPVSNMLKIL